MKKGLFIFLLACLFMPFTAEAQTVNAKAYYTDSEGTSYETDSIDNGEAPLAVEFRANPADMDGYTASYEWHFNKIDPNTGSAEFLVRYEEDTQYTFVESGVYSIVLKTQVTQDGVTTELASKSIGVVIADSKLEFPNAFSPNGDGLNDTFKAKKGYRSIVDFHAYIFNRWGQKLYEWTDVAGEWDGTHNGHPVKDGVYFVLVKARGADGREYNIRRDVNVLRGLNQGNSGSSSAEE